MIQPGQTPSDTATTKLNDTGGNQGDTGHKRRRLLDSSQDGAATAFILFHVLFDNDVLHVLSFPVDYHRVFHFEHGPLPLTPPTTTITYGSSPFSVFRGGRIQDGSGQGRGYAIGGGGGGGGVDLFLGGRRGDGGGRSDLVKVPRFECAEDLVGLLCQRAVGSEGILVGG